MFSINLLIVFWFYVAQSDKYVLRIFVEHTKFRPAYTFKEYRLKTIYLDRNKTLLIISVHYLELIESCP